MKNPEPLTLEQAYAYALRLVNQRDYSQARLKQKLLQRGATNEHAEAIIDRLVDLKFLDDTRFARSIIRNEATYRHASTRSIALKLRQKGVTATTVETELPQATDIPEEFERAHVQAERFLRRHKGEITFETKQKLSAFLFRKGFSMETIRKVSSGDSIDKKNATD